MQPKSEERTKILSFTERDSTVFKLKICYKIKISLM